MNAGRLPLQDAWHLVSRGEAVLVDVRTLEERKFVGHVPESKHVAWVNGLFLSRNLCSICRWSMPSSRSPMKMPCSIPVVWPRKKALFPGFPAVRPSLAFYNTCEEIDRMLAVVRRLARGKGKVAA